MGDKSEGGLPLYVGWLQSPPAAGVPTEKHENLAIVVIIIVDHLLNEVDQTPGA